MTLVRNFGQFLRGFLEISCDLAAAFGFWQDGQLCDGCAGRHRGRPKWPRVGFCQQKYQDMTNTQIQMALVQIMSSRNLKLSKWGSWKVQWASYTSNLKWQKKAPYHPSDFISVNRIPKYALDCAAGPCNAWFEFWSLLFLLSWILSLCSTSVRKNCFPF